MGQDTGHTGRTDHAGSTERTGSVGITNLGDGAPAVEVDPRQQARRTRRFNPFFAAAWLLTVMMIAVGTLWPLAITGTGPGRFADYLPQPTLSPTYIFTANLLTQAGPSLLVAGCVSAVALLTLHGVRRRPA